MKMMKAKELRQGNYKAEPIPLTPEILEKVGFIKIPHFTVMNSMTFDVGKGRYLSIGCIGTPNEMLWLCNGDLKIAPTDLICLHNFDYDGKLYLHTIQNWVELLTKKELEIKF